MEKLIAVVRSHVNLDHYFIMRATYDPTDEHCCAIYDTWNGQSWGNKIEDLVLMSYDEAIAIEKKLKSEI